VHYHVKRQTENTINTENRALVGRKKGEEEELAWIVLNQHHLKTL
jgi:hypothetical protein